MNSRVVALDRQVDGLLKWRERARGRMASMEERLAILEERSIEQEGRIDNLERIAEEKVAEIEELKGKLCHCSERSPVIASGSGTQEEPFELEYADQEEGSTTGSYRTPPVEAAEAVCTCAEAVAIEGDDEDEEMAGGPALYNRSFDDLLTNLDRELRR